MIALLLALLGLASAAPVRVVRAGETVESIAAELGDAALAAAIRGENGLSAGANPVPGTALRLPPLHGHADVDAVVLTVAGEATLDAGGEVGPALPRALVRAGDLVCTGIDGHLTLRLAADPVTGLHDDLTLLPATCARLDAAGVRDGARSTVVAVSRGQVEVRPAEVPGDVIIVTGAGVSAGREGGFRVAVEDGGAARTEAVGAPVAVIGGGVERALEVGQGSRTAPGEAPSDPIDLLPASALRVPSESAVLWRPRFEWAAVPHALGYRLEISANPDFTELLVAVEVPEPHYQPETLLLPRRTAGLWWRVSALDLAGFTGTPSAPRRVEVPRPPR